jgi:hypothetical protein
MQDQFSNIIKDNINPYIIIKIDFFISDEQVKIMEKEFEDIYEKKMDQSKSLEEFEFYKEIFNETKDIDISPQESFWIIRKKHWQTIHCFLLEMSYPFKAIDGKEIIWNMENLDTIKDAESYIYFKNFIKYQYNQDDVLDRILKDKKLNEIHLEILEGR